MPKYDLRSLNFMLMSIGIDKILNSADKSALKELKKILGECDLDINDCYHHPAIL